MPAVRSAAPVSGEEDESVADVQVEASGGDIRAVASLLDVCLDPDHVTVRHHEYAVKSLIPLQLLITVPTAFLLTKFVLEPLIGPWAEKWKETVRRRLRPLQAFSLTIRLVEESLVLEAPLGTSHEITAEIWDTVQKTLAILERDGTRSRLSAVRFLPSAAGRLLIFGYEGDRAVCMVEPELSSWTVIPPDELPLAERSKPSIEDWVREQAAASDTYQTALGQRQPNESEIP